MSTAWHRAGAVGAGGAALVALSACQAGFEFGVGERSVDADHVAEQISQELEEQIGTAPQEVTCPEDLPAEEGAQITCRLTEAGETYDVTVTTASVQDGEVSIDFEVAERPR
jgi:hypothetical protein